MPNLSIKDVPEPLAESLRQRARRHHRSLQGELMAILEQAANESAPMAASPLPLPGFRDAGGQGFLHGTQTIEETAAELRRRFPQPIASGPLAVDLLRAERDSR